MDNSKFTGQTKDGGTGAESVILEADSTPKWEGLADLDQSAKGGKKEKTTKESLESGEIPDNIKKELKLVPIDSPASVKLQEQLGSIFNHLYPDSKIQPIFLLCDDMSMNAFCLRYTDPPMIGFNLGCCCGDNKLSDAAIAGILAHEFAHYRINKEFGTEANSKLEEGLADWYALDDLYSAGIDNTDFREALYNRSGASVFAKLANIVDPHPSDDTRVAIWDAWHTDKYSNRGEEFDSYEKQSLLPQIDCEFVEIILNGKMEKQKDIFDVSALYVFMGGIKAKGLDSSSETFFSNPDVFILVLEEIEKSVAVDLRGIIPIIQQTDRPPNEKGIKKIGAKLWEFYNKDGQEGYKKQIYLSIAEELGNFQKKDGIKLKFRETKNFESEPNAENARKLANLIKEQPLLCYYEDFDISQLILSGDIKKLFREALTNTDLAQCLVAYGMCPFSLKMNYEDNIFFQIASSNSEMYEYVNKEINTRSTLFLEFESAAEFLDQYYLRILEQLGPDSPLINNYRLEYCLLKRNSGSNDILFPELINEDFELFIFINISTLSIDQFYGSLGGYTHDELPNLDISSEQLEEICENLSKFLEESYTPETRQNYVDMFKKIVSFKRTGVEPTKFAIQHSITLIDESSLLLFIIDNTEGKSGLDIFTKDETLDLLIKSGFFDLREDEILEVNKGCRACYDNIQDLAEVLDFFYFHLNLDPTETNSVEFLIKINSEAQEKGVNIKACSLFAEFKIREMLAPNKLDFNTASAAMQNLDLDIATYSKLIVRFQLSLEDSLRVDREYSEESLKKLYILFEPTDIFNRINLGSKINSFSNHVKWDNLLNREDRLVDLLNELNSIEDGELKQKSLLRLLTVASADIKKISTLNKIVETLTDSIKSEFGIDNNSEGYYQQLTIVISKYKAELPKKCQKLFFDALSKKLLFQERLTELCSSIVKGQMSNSFNDTIKEQIGVDALNVVLSANVFIRVSFLNFLINSPTDESVERIANIVLKRSPTSTIGIEKWYKQNLILLHKSFNELPLEVQTVAKAQLVIPARHGSIGAKEWRECKNYCFTTLQSNGVNITHETREFIEAYLDSIPEHVPGARRTALGALLSAKEKGLAEDQSEAEILCAIIELMGPAEVKAGQAASGHPDTGEDYAKKLVKLKNHAAEPSRAELFSWIKEQVPQELKDKIINYGEVLGSGSLVVSVEVTTDEGVAVLQLLRPFALERANAGFRRLDKAIDNAKITSERKQYLKDLVSQAKLDISDETDFNLSDQQFAVFGELYEDVKARIKKEKYIFKTPKLLYQKGNCRLIEKVEGVHFVNLPKGEKKTEIAKVIVAHELANIFSGAQFDKDSHGGNVIIKDNVIYRIDSGAVKLNKPSDRDFKLLTSIIQEGLASLKESGKDDFINAFFEAARNKKQELGQLPELIGEVQRALVGLAEYFNEMNKEDYVDVLKSIYPHVDKDIQRIMREAAPKAGGLVSGLVSAVKYFVGSPPIKFSKG